MIIHESLLKFQEIKELVFTENKQAYESQKILSLQKIKCILSLDKRNN